MEKLERNVDPVEIEFRRDDARMCLFEPGLQTLHAFGNGREVPAKTGHYDLNGIVDLILVDRREAAVAHDDRPVDDDMAHAAPGFDVHKLPHRAVERKPGRVAHIDECEVGLAAGRDPSDPA